MIFSISRGQRSRSLSPFRRTWFPAKPGPTEPKFVTIPADLVLLETQHFLATQLARANIRLVLESSAPMRIRVDPAQIQQVLINLVQNAADSIAHDGTITLRARCDRKPLANGETDVVILEVTDTGKGIPPEIEKRLFDPFFSTKETGTGLGLPISARLVQKQGGALQYQTRLGHGTTFGVVLPREISDTANSANSNANIQTGGDQANR